MFFLVLGSRLELSLRGRLWSRGRSFDAWATTETFRQAASRLPSFIFVKNQNTHSSLLQTFSKKYLLFSRLSKRHLMILNNIFSQNSKRSGNTSTRASARSTDTWCLIRVISTLLHPQSGKELALPLLNTLACFIWYFSLLLFNQNELF